MKKRIPGTLLHDFLELSVAKLPDKTALVCENDRHTYAQVEAMSNRLANALLKHGVERSDRVAILLDNSTESVISIFGILKAGAAFVVINPQTKAQKLKFILNNCGANALITQTKYVALLPDLENDAESLKFIIVCDASEQNQPGDGLRLPLKEILDSYPDSPPDADTIDLDLAAIIYTSGTTGFPKGACFTHRGMVSASSSITTYLENVESDIILDALPISFDYGLYQVLMSSQVGGTLVLERSFTYPQQIINAVEREKVTGFPGVPTLFAIMLKLKDIKKHDFSSVQYVTNTAAALPPSHILQLKDIFPHARIYSMYGITECKRVSYMPPDELDDRPSSVGKGMPNEEVYIVDDKGKHVGPGVVGELVVRGSNVMMGYWKMPEASAKILKPGKYPGERVLYTGDLFKMDEDGYLYFVSRKDDIIKCRGEKVSPKEVENVIYELPEVLEVAVIGVDDEIQGQAIKAIVVPAENATIDNRKIISHCRQNLEGFMVPKYVEFASELPKTSSGKIIKRNLLEREESGAV